MALSNVEKQARHRVRRVLIRSEPGDIAAVENEFGPLPYDASLEDKGRRWRLYQARAAARLATDDLHFGRVLIMPRRRARG